MVPFNSLWLLNWCIDIGALVAGGICSFSPVFTPPQSVDHRLIVRTWFGPVLHKKKSPNQQPNVIPFVAKMWELNVVLLGVDSIHLV